MVAFFALTTLSGNLKGFKGINGLNAFKAATVNGLKDFFQNPGCIIEN